MGSRNHIIIKQQFICVHFFHHRTATKIAQVVFSKLINLNLIISRACCYESSTVGWTCVWLGCWCILTIMGYFTWYDKCHLSEKHKKRFPIQHLEAIGKRERMLWAVCSFRPRFAGVLVRRLGVRPSPRIFTTLENPFHPSIFKQKKRRPHFSVTHHRTWWELRP